MSSRKQQALDRLLDVSGPGCFNEVTGTWMVGRRHHHHHHHHRVAPPPPSPEPSSEPSEPEMTSPLATTASRIPATTTPSGSFYPDILTFTKRGSAGITVSTLKTGDRFSTTEIYPNLPNTAGAKSGTVRHNYVVTSRLTDPYGWPRGFTFTLLP